MILSCYKILQQNNSTVNQRDNHLRYSVIPTTDDTD